MKTKKSFLGLEDAYGFFKKHSNQLGQAGEAIKSFVERHEFPCQSLRICFLGCGDIEIALGLVQHLKDKHTLDVTLVDEHHGWLQDASRQVGESGAAKVSAHTALEEAHGPFDLIIAYHTMYYVLDLQQALRTLHRHMGRHSILLTALASRANKLKQCATNLFQLRGRDLPYWQEEDLEAALPTTGFKWETVPMYSAVSCTDAEGARTALINFLTGTLEQPSHEALEVFTPFKDGVRLYVPMLDTLTVCHIA
jgi:hypothetical protein